MNISSTHIPQQGINKNELREKLNDALGNVKKTEDIILLFGESAAGKSTAINLLRGKKIIKVPLAKILGNDDIAGWAFVLEGDEKGSAKIGYSKNAETQFPTLYDSHLDVPGYNLSKTIAMEIAQNIATQRFVENAKSVRIVFCSPWDAFTGGRGDLFIKSSKAIQDLFKDYTAFKNSFLFLVTKNFLNVTKKNVVAELNQFTKDKPEQKQWINFLIREEGKYIHLFTDHDKDTPQGYEETAADINKTIMEMVPLKVDKEQIGYFLTDSAKNALKEAFTPILNAGNQHLSDLFDLLVKLSQKEQELYKLKYNLGKKLKDLKKENSYDPAIEKVKDYVNEIAKRKKEIAAIRVNDSDFEDHDLKVSVQATRISYVVNDKFPPLLSDYAKSMGVGGVAGLMLSDYYSTTRMVMTKALASTAVGAGAGYLYTYCLGSKSVVRSISHIDAVRPIVINSQIPIKRVIKSMKGGMFSKESYENDNKRYKVTYTAPEVGGSAEVVPIFPLNIVKKSEDRIKILTLEIAYLEKKKEIQGANLEAADLISKIQESKTALKTNEKDYRLLLELFEYVRDAIGNKVAITKFKMKYKTFINQLSKL